MARTEAVLVAQLFDSGWLVVKQRFHEVNVLLLGLNRLESAFDAAPQTFRDPSNL